MPSIALFDAGSSLSEATRPRVEPPRDPAHAFQILVTPDVDALLASAADSDAACVVLGGDLEAGLAALRRLHEAAPDLAIVATEAPNPEAAVAAAAAGAHAATPAGTDARFVTLALARAALCTADQRELRRLRAQRADGDALGPTPAPGPFSDARVVPQLRELEREAIRHALAATGGRVGQAAKMLGMGRATLYRRLATLDVVRTP